MFRFNGFLFSVLLLASGLAHAETRLLSFSYYNWSERMSISGGGLENDAPANISSLGVQMDFLTTNKDSGWLYSAAILTGTGTGGSTSGTPAYFASYQPFFGLMGSGGYFFRVEKRVYLELGGLMLYRSLKWPDAAGNTSKSGADLNFGATANIRIRLFRNLDYCQSIGTLLSKASTIWSLGLGYRF